MISPLRHLSRSLLISNKPTCIGLQRKLSSSSDQVQVEFDDKTGLATLVFANAPVNSFSRKFLADVTNEMKSLETNSDVRGVMLTSQFDGRVFSAGFDILEMFQKPTEDLQKFWGAVHDWYFQFFGSTKPVVAAINGHSPAGGCALSLMCDFRVMAEDRVIGLNETQLGIVAPFFFADLMERAIGVRRTEHALLAGTLFKSQQARQIGLVDQVVPLEEVKTTALKQLTLLSKIPQPAYGITKQLMRGASLKKLDQCREADIATFVNLIEKPIVQKAMGYYLQQLKKKKAAP